MQKTIKQILEQTIFTKSDVIQLLDAKEKDRIFLFEKANEVKLKNIGNKVYYRGLIEFSNLCEKDCLYCGIRAGNNNTTRYEIEEELILKAVQFAWENKYASVVFQSGERSDVSFIEKVNSLLVKSKKLTNNEIGITLSLGEQSEETYRKWYELGAHRYLLRIETSTEELYYKIHPRNTLHSFSARIEALKTLKKIGFQVGTGVMIGLPFQNLEHLANDILFMKDFDIHMIGMGPYIEHDETPLFKFKDLLLPQKERFDLTLKMIAIMRILMPKINIAAATALQAIDKVGREKALKIGANIIMPNITPSINRVNYQLYNNKPCIDEGADDCTKCLEARIAIAGGEIGYGEWGDSIHFQEVKK